MTENEPELSGRPLPRSIDEAKQLSEDHESVDEINETLEAVADQIDVLEKYQNVLTENRSARVAEAETYEGQHGWTPKDIIRSLARDYRKGAPEQAVVSVITHATGLPRTEAEETVEQLKRDGEALEPVAGRLEVI